MKKLLALLCLGLPGIVCGGPTVLVDAVPTGGEFIGVSPIGLPFQDAEKEKPKDIEEGLNGAIASILPGAAAQGFDYLCLLSAPGDQPIEIPIAAAKASLKLSRTKTVVLVLFYRGGRPAAGTVSYSTGSPEAKKPNVSTVFRKISVPPGTGTAGWIYFNLPRIQAEAEKTGSPVIFLQAGGAGGLTAVPIPGMKQPLMVPEEKTTLNATWYLDPKLDGSQPGEILGHPLPAK